MSTNNVYQPINCDDYDNLELACQRHLIITLTLKDTEVFEAKAYEIVSRKNIEYLVVEMRETAREIRLDTIHSFSHPDIGTIVVSEE
ncbi:Rho-binding antiterminator [Citrobacter sp. JGM124]|uniref:Rho-binding antiterminator n=1 Tax=Citrobacter sp. JGM124 TaxID=2799789 RepID=UPI001BAAB6FD|nr:Rho-binding antiterminator [Citrobacter sp. JGM124]MBS0848560.1 Rho-binding antiterminator [Citrobacter sp. JGM124]